jgi:hypothetical protein
VLPFDRRRGQDVADKQRVYGNGAGRIFAEIALNLRREEEERLDGREEGTQREAGRKEGWQAGRQEGRKEGRMAGRKERRKEGRKERPLGGAW